ncbi:hypothetical protein [Streptomyces sp. NPDC059783]|uniref:hypothetical protein n=1 Tax=Streptomyces sp. NPDC059783 TaxID=3346944 RepID=UPI003653D04C
MTSTRPIFQWQPADLAAIGRIISTLMRDGVDFHHPSGMGATTTLLIRTPQGDLLAEPGHWLVRTDSSTWQVTKDSASAVRAAAQASDHRLGDLVEYDASTVTFPDGPRTVPGGRGRLADVFAADHDIVATVEHEDGTNGAPLLADLRPADPTQTSPHPATAAE